MSPRRGRTAARGVTPCFAVLSSVSGPPKYKAVDVSGPPKYKAVDVSGPPKYKAVDGPNGAIAVALVGSVRARGSWPSRTLSKLALSTVRAHSSESKKRLALWNTNQPVHCFTVRGKVCDSTTIKSCTKAEVEPYRPTARISTNAEDSKRSSSNQIVHLPSMDQSSFETCHGDISSDSDHSAMEWGVLPDPLTDGVAVPPGGVPSGIPPNYSGTQLLHETSSCIYHTALCSSEASDIESTHEPFPVVGTQSHCIVEYGSNEWDKVTESTVSGQSMSSQSVGLPLTVENVNNDNECSKSPLSYESEHGQDQEAVGDNLESECDDVSQDVSSRGGVQPFGKIRQEDVRHRSKIDRRTSLPFARKPKMSLWSILRHCLGKDLAYVSMPIVLNEPISLLQRFCEDFEHIHLLYEAARRRTPAERLLFVSVFSATPFAAALDRFLKPFNPLLGETYEFSHGDNFRYIAEQVSHHPPIAAFHVESKNCISTSGHVSQYNGHNISESNLKVESETSNIGQKETPSQLPLFEIDGDTGISTSFSANSVTVTLHGAVRVLLRTVFGNVEEYIWERPRTVVHNLFVGTTWTEVVGSSEVVSSHPQQLTCQLDYIPKSAGPINNHRKSSGRRMHTKSEKSAAPRPTCFRRNSLRNAPSRKSNWNSGEPQSAGPKTGTALRPIDSAGDDIDKYQGVGEVVASDISLSSKDRRTSYSCSHTRRHSLGCSCRRAWLPHIQSCVSDGQFDNSTDKVRNRQADADFVCNPSCLGLTPKSCMSRREISNEEIWKNVPSPQEVIEDNPNVFRLSGQVKDAQGNVYIEIGGHWNKLVWAIPTSDSISFTDTDGCEENSTVPAILTNVTTASGGRDSSLATTVYDLTPVQTFDAHNSGHAQSSVALDSPQLTDCHKRTTSTMSPSGNSNHQDFSSDGQHKAKTTSLLGMGVNEYNTSLCTREADEYLIATLGRAQVCCSPVVAGAGKEIDQSVISRWGDGVEELVNDTQNVLWMRFPESKHLVEGYGISIDRDELSEGGQKPQPDSYGMTPVCVTLNEVTEDYDSSIVHMPATDSRYRPDQRMYEQGMHEAAQSMKLILENEQRERAKQRKMTVSESYPSVHRNSAFNVSETINCGNPTPRWFEKVCGVASTAPRLRYKYTGEYWRVRDLNRPFEKTESIFETKPVDKV